MNEVLTKILEKYRKLGINEQIDYDKFYLYSIITHSTAIEGSTVTEIENQLLFDEGISSTKPIKEQLMNLDLKKAYEKSYEYAKNHSDITIEILCSLSSIAMANTGSNYNTISGNFSAAKGELRLLNVSAGRGGKSYIAWQKVPDKLKKICDYINQERKKISDKYNEEDVYTLSFQAHYLLATVHPWADGNGRMSRLVMNMIQREFNVIPSIVKKEDKIEYIKTLSKCQEIEDSTEFVNFMFNKHINNLKEQINNYINSTKKDLIDNNCEIKSSKRHR